jgi:ATP-binding cassette, subfamily F, member 3
MLTVSRLSKSFHNQVLFENVSFSLNPGDRVGLVGPNGCGKTTLLRILTGAEPADAGYAARAPNLRLGYLPQGFEIDPSLIVAQVLGQASGSIAALEEDLAQAAADLVENPADALLQDRYDDLLRRIEASAEGQLGDILAVLGLDQVDPALPVGRLSGGQKTRLALALTLLEDPQLLLLDEPTNYLDIPMLEWLEAWLAEFPGAALIVSHDRTFLDRSVTSILELDPQQQQVRFYGGSYSQYRAQRQAEIEKQWSAFEDQQLEIQRMQADIARVKSQAAYTERQTRSARIGGHEMRGKGVKDHLRGRAVKVARKAKAREKRLERYIDSDERVEKPQEARAIHVAFAPPSRSGRAVLALDDLSVGYQPEAPLLQGVQLYVTAGQRIAITGANGSGKTTLLRTIAGELQPLAGAVHLAASVRLGCMSQDQSALPLDQTPVEVLLPYFRTQTEARSLLASTLIIGDEALKPTRLLSFGQRARLMLALLVAQECTCLLLDEPLSPLDIPSREQFEHALDAFPGSVLVVTHDRSFIERFAEAVWWVEGGTVSERLQV